MLLTIPFNIFSTNIFSENNFTHISMAWSNKYQFGGMTSLTVASIGISESYLHLFLRLSEQSVQTFYKGGTHI